MLRFRYPFRICYHDQVREVKRHIDSKRVEAGYNTLSPSIQARIMQIEEHTWGTGNNRRRQGCTKQQLYFYTSRINIAYHYEFEESHHNNKLDTRLDPKLGGSGPVGDGVVSHQ